MFTEFSSYFIPHTDNFYRDEENFNPEAVQLKFDMFNQCIKIIIDNNHSFY